MLGMSAYSDWFGLLVDCGLMCCCYDLFVLLVVYCVVLLLGFGFRLDFDFFDVEFVDLLWRFCGFVWCYGFARLLLCLRCAWWWFVLWMVLVGCCLIWCFWCLLRLAVWFELDCAVVYVLFNYVNRLSCLVWCWLRVGYLLSSLGLLRFLLVGVCDGC